MFFFQGTNVHVVVPTIVMPIFKDKFSIDKTYTLSNFTVVPNNLVFKPTNHMYYIKLTGGTSVNDVNNHVVNAKPDNFTPFPDIITGRYKKDVLIGDFLSHDLINFYTLYVPFITMVIINHASSFYRHHLYGGYYRLHAKSEQWEKTTGQLHT